MYAGATPPSTSTPMQLAASQPEQQLPAVADAEDANSNDAPLVAAASNAGPSGHCTIPDATNHPHTAAASLCLPLAACLPCCNTGTRARLNSCRAAAAPQVATAHTCAHRFVRMLLPAVCVLCGCAACCADVRECVAQPWAQGIMPACPGGGAFACAACQVCVCKCVHACVVSPCVCRAGEAAQSSLPAPA